MSQNVLVVAAHPDDEILGLGGALGRHVADGDNVHVIIAGEGPTARGDTNVSQEAFAAAQAAAKVLGVYEPSLLGLPDNRLDTLALLEIIQPIESAIQSLAPRVVYTHCGTDLNSDHRIIHQATVTACRPLPGSPVRQLYAFETVSSTEWSTAAMGAGFQPTHFVDISDFWGQKRSALECYANEMRLFPHARSYEAVEALAVLRGSQSGVGMAEAFETLLYIRD
jgi:N-acetylglucosamine malate deacetylase 1